jgi:hypothetical protein
MSEPKLTKAFCNRCLQRTNHQIVAQHTTSKSEIVESVGEIYWDDEYEMLECCGCGTVLFKHESIFSEDPEPTIIFYPPRVSRPSPKWKWKLPYQITGLLNETYAALHADSRTLALMGARAIVDMIMIDKVGDIGTFPQKLEGLEQQGFVSNKNRSILSTVLDAGSAAAHRGYIPEDEELNCVMDIIENLLEAVYILEKLAKKLQEKTPPRKPVK